MPDVVEGAISFKDILDGVFGVLDFFLTKFGTVDYFIPHLPNKDSVHLHKGFSITDIGVGIWMAFQLFDCWKCNNFCMFRDSEETVNKDFV
jgi:hypothetical protein